MDQFREIQENLFEYFEDIDNYELVGFIESFIYQLPAKNSNISKLIENFLEENELMDAFLYYHEILKKDKQPIFARYPTQIEMMNNIRHGLLSIAFNRFRRIV